MDNVFGLDIGTRNVVGTVGYRTEDGKFLVKAQYMKQHETRAMLDGQIHDIGRVARTISAVKAQLESQLDEPLADVCIAAAGRVLKTVTVHVEYEYAQETMVTADDLHTLDLLGIEKAQNILKEKNDTRYKFYCVGYSVVKYFLNEELFISIEGHKAEKIGEDLIVTFLPEDVVDGLYTAVGQAGLTVANMTLEPIAAINVAIPENFRMLNIALVDVGAGTSDISVTSDGSIIAYGMIPDAGDELTELIVQHYLVDFQTAEAMKLASTTDEEITYEDIMSISHTIPATEIWDLITPTVDKITTEVSAKIKELNGDKTVSACFVVGGGGKVHGFTEMLAEKLELPQERVALRGEEVLKQVVFEQEEIRKDPLLVTPIGICLNYYEQKNNFIMVKFNGERIKLYDNNRLTIMDAALQAGFPNDSLFPKRGLPINFTVNGAARIARGEAGEPAVVTLNGEPASINTPLTPNCEITIEPSTAGDNAVYIIEQLPEYRESTISFIINGQKVVCPKFVEVNGSLEPGSYEIKEGDAVETRNFYTVGQVAEFMDVDVDEDQEILVNNRPAGLDTLVYENFSIDWTTEGFGVAQETNNRYNATETVEPGRTEPEEKKEVQIPPVQEDTSTCTVTVNGEPVDLIGKKSYIFVDIFDRITFDLNAGRGRAIVTLVNGENAEFSQQLHDGDRIELYWKEN
ncbi:MAG: pilus assembly protein PilM [Lachnospiraceae bacterium]|nr:pilus assembly protein PilM [Lachnospiraceae bacterium]